MLTCDLSGYAEAAREMVRGAVDDREDETSGVVEIPITRDGKALAVVMWFDLDVDPEGEFAISTAPTIMELLVAECTTADRSREGSRFGLDPGCGGQVCERAKTTRGLR